MLTLRRAAFTYGWGRAKVLTFFHIGSIQIRSVSGIVMVWFWLRFWSNSGIVMAISSRPKTARIAVSRPRAVYDVLSVLCCRVLG